MENQWQLQEAKSKFSRIVEQARSSGPQFVTRHGDNAVVVLSYEDYRKMLRPEDQLVDFLRSSPFIEETSEDELDLHRNKDLPRDIEL